MGQKHKSFETERLIIRPTTVFDSAFILELFNTPKWLQNIGDKNVNSIEDASTYIKTKMLPQLDKLGYSNYTIIRKSDDQLIGVCGLYDREGIDGLDLGFAFLPEYEKKGYAFESARKLTEVAIRYFKISQISAIVSKENKPSQKLLEKLGFIFEKTIKLPNDEEAVFLYTIIA